MKSKIYTKTGDCGETSLLGGTRVKKNHTQVKAYGEVDELMVQIGFLIALLPKLLDYDELRDVLKEVQEDLFVMGSYLALEPNRSLPLPAFNIERVTLLEILMDQMDARLPPLKHFVMPRGSELSVRAHLCRVSTRRVERSIVTLQEDDVFSERDIGDFLIYLNRLSDYFFVLSRKLLLSEGADEELWIPSKN